MKYSKFIKYLVALISTFALAACILSGGSGGQSAKVKVYGDSLADSGTFKSLLGSRTFTIQETEYEPNVLWNEKIAKYFGQQSAALDGSSLCSYYTATATSYTSDAKCTNFAIGGARINIPSAANTPASIIAQLQASAANISVEDVALIDGGGNDVADLVAAFSKAGSDQGSQFLQLLNTLPSSSYLSLLGQGKFNEAGVIYMENLASKFYSEIKTNLLDKGVTKVVLVNMPNVILTPRFKLVIAAAGSQGATLSAIVTQWVNAYNTKLAALAAVDSGKVLVVDLYSFFNRQLTSSAYTNVSTPACPVVSTASDGSPNYEFKTCTASKLSAQVPTGVSGGADWWKKYLFSDNFHPTPLAHQLLADEVIASIKSRNW